MLEIVMYYTQLNRAALRKLGWNDEFPRELIRKSIEFQLDLVSMTAVPEADLPDALAKIEQIKTEANHDFCKMLWPEGSIFDRLDELPGEWAANRKTLAA